MNNFFLSILINSDLQINILSQSAFSLYKNKSENIEL